MIIADLWLKQIFGIRVETLFNVFYQALQVITVIRSIVREN